MNRKEVISQLEELIDDRRSFMVGDYKDCFDKDVRALEYAIKELKKCDSKKCDCCKDENYVLIVDDIQLCKKCLERLKEISL